MGVTVLVYKENTLSQQGSVMMSATPFMFLSLTWSVPAAVSLRNFIIPLILSSEVNVRCNEKFCDLILDGSLRGSMN